MASQAVAPTPFPQQAELDRHKRFAHAVRTEPLAFWDMATLENAFCTCCGTRMSHVSTYPFHDSGAFARQIILWCAACGFGMVPGTSFPLEDYYANLYAAENRGDRDMDPAAYFALAKQPDPPPGLKRYFGRARGQLIRIKSLIGPFTSMLDVGAGPGYALHLSGAKRRDAIEPDLSSRKYLDHIGATVIDWDSIEPNTYNVVLMSHVLEHFLPDQVRPRLESIARSLKPGGILYIEVPPGGLGWKNYAYKHEPHTLFFTPEALHTLCDSIGLEVVMCAPLAKTLDKVLDRADPIYQPNVQDPLDNPRGKLTAICMKSV